MTFNAIQDNIPESKSRLLIDPVHTNEHQKMTEDGPEIIKPKKNISFRKILISLWGHIGG